MTGCEKKLNDFGGRWLVEEAAGRKPPLFVYCRHRGALHSNTAVHLSGNYRVWTPWRVRKSPFCASLDILSLSESVSKLSVHWSQLRGKSVTHVHTTTANWSVDKLGTTLQDNSKKKSHQIFFLTFFWTNEFEIFALLLLYRQLPGCLFTPVCLVYPKTLLIHQARGCVSLGRLMSCLYLYLFEYKKTKVSVLSVVPLCLLLFSLLIPVANSSFQRAAL